MAWFWRLRNRAAQLRRTEIQRVITTRIIDRILIPMRGCEKTESRQGFGLHSQDESDRDTKKPSEIRQDEY